MSLTYDDGFRAGREDYAIGAGWAPADDTLPMGVLSGEWMTRNRALALCKRYGHSDEVHAGTDEGGPYLECSRCGDRTKL